MSHNTTVRVAMKDRAHIDAALREMGLPAVDWDRHAMTGHYRNRTTVDGVLNIKSAYGQTEPVGFTFDEDTGECEITGDWMCLYGALGDQEVFKNAVARGYALAAVRSTYDEYASRGFTVSEHKNSAGETEVVFEKADY